MCFCSCGSFVPFQLVIDTKIANRSVLSIGITSCPYTLCFVVATEIVFFALCAEEKTLRSDKDGYGFLFRNTLLVFL